MIRPTPRHDRHRRLELSATLFGLLLAVTAGAQSTSPNPESWRDTEALRNAEADARAAVNGFFVAFNQADNDALQKYCNYPHVFVGSNGSVAVVDDRWEMGFDRLREREGWHSSHVTAAEPFLVKEDKVHYRLTFTRKNAAGEVYRTMTGLWILTLQDGQWGVSLRSY